jgi:hypothetical protein
MADGRLEKIWKNPFDSRSRLLRWMGKLIYHPFKINLRPIPGPAYLKKSERFTCLVLSKIQDS